MEQKLWQGRFVKQLDSAADDFNSSIRVDSLMYRQDIQGSIAHAEMLGKCGIISGDEKNLIVSGLNGILSDIDSGKLKIDMSFEDIHSFVEAELTLRIGDTGKKLHTARSRNDQVATDTRLYLRERLGEIKKKLLAAIKATLVTAEGNTETIMPGYTHMQRAQPISFAHAILAYASMFMRDVTRIDDCLKRMNISPLGSCALAGTTFCTDRFYTASLLGFDSPCINSIDGVSDRDFVTEAASCCAICAVHLSRLCEELILFCSWEFGFIELDDAFSTGSSIMPQKKNPDIAELIRGKSARVCGNLVTLLTMQKSLPLAYNKDMQEDKEALFDSLDTLEAQLNVLAPMLLTMKIKPENMRSAASRGFINATDMADYLVGKGMPFRSAYKISGEAVAYCIANGKTLETLSLGEYKGFSELFDEGVYNAVDLDACLNRRCSFGGTAPERVKEQMAAIDAFLKENTDE